METKSTKCFLAAKPQEGKWHQGTVRAYTKSSVGSS